ncbi:hypothetical protein HSBAA_09300 [Vreelandella sulfidaeris]|uniref:FAD-binding oxidoreductase/transferase type 4 C-terminal domain-containing protein n=1 Tax=Vreelandella sulfidaeris TaxID=115553 RepID=A0A455U7W4_9GAMM|nr:hypothetical protein HSBAA_09300 [Halomonas sulfidaeris]
MTLKDGYSEDEIDSIIAAGGRQGEIFDRLRNLRDRYSEQIRKQYPQTRHMPRRVSGYNLDDLLPERGFNLASALCGSEGTCMTVLQATLKLTDNVAHRTLMVVGFDNVAMAGDHVPLIIEAGPIALEAIDKRLFQHEADQHMNEETLEQMPKGDAFLMIEFGGENAEDTDAQARQLIGRLQRLTAHPAIIRLFTTRNTPTAFGPCAKPAWGDRFPAARTTTALAGLGRRRGAARKVGNYVRDIKQLYKSTATSAQFMGISARVVSIHGSISIYSPKKGSKRIATLPRKPLIWWSPMAGRCPGNTVMARRVANCSRECTDRN